MKRQTKDWQNIILKHIYEKELESRMHKEHLKLKKIKV